MTAYIARRLDRLEERLGVSDGRPKIEFIFIHIVSPGPDGPVCDIQVAHLGPETLLHRGKDETLDDFQNRVREHVPRVPGRIPSVILGPAKDLSGADFSAAEPVLNR